MTLTTSSIDTALESVQISDTAAREVVAWAQPQGIKVNFELRREYSVDVIYVLLKAR